MDVPLRASALSSCINLKVTLMIMVTSIYVRKLVTGGLYNIHRFIV